ncbi:glycosyltransferase family 4 protein [Cryobacterium sp. TMT2-23]|uniref:glycosyltransferase family 4 protein n=1 Tax=Cryobacterium sp. TMT2-23 TaxID=1259252 RepID=UPI00141B6566|nr:glycosyltransferase family 4 protein [Cryobacterium sp. TMT2-23]
MKIAIVSQYYAPEAIRIPDTLARGLAARGHEVRVITGFPNYPDGNLFPGYSHRWPQTEWLDGIQVRRVPMVISHSYNPIARFANYFTFAWSAAVARGFVRSADVVYVYATQMTPAIGPSVWRAIFGTPYVLHIQDLWPESVTDSSMVGAGAMKRILSGILNPWLRFLYRTASATIAIAPSMARMLSSRGVPDDRLHTVLNWDASEDSLAAARSAPVDNGQVSIVYAGNLGDHQALDTVIRAANAVKHLDHVVVTIVGSGVAEERLRALALELDAHNVNFKGRVAPEDMEAIHAQSDFQIVSLKDRPIFEGTIPSKFQASLSHGIPVITAVRGDVQDMVRSNGIGYACDPEDVDQLAQAFTEAGSTDAAQRSKMGRSAREYYRSTMSIDSGVGAIEKILNDAHKKGIRKARAE